ncbi:DUF3037 domain-containing protein [Xanthomonas perforans]
MLYHYWLIRHVPDPLRGERVNLGVLVGQDGGDWALRRVRSYRRANLIGGDASQSADWLRSLEAETHETREPTLELFSDDAHRPLTVARIEGLRPRLNNVLQLSESDIVTGDSAGSTADFLFRVLVSESHAPRRSNTRQRLVRVLRDTYGQLGTDSRSHIEERPVAHAGRQRGRFDFAVLDGQVEQLSHVWSFDLKDIDKLEQEIQAWNYLVTRIRNDGGWLSPNAGSGHSELLPLNSMLPGEVPIVSLFQVPGDQTARSLDAFEAAKEAWAELGVRAVDSADVDNVTRGLSLT